MTLEHIHGGHLRQASRRYGRPETDFIDFSANINPLGPSERVVQSITANMGSITSYPDPECWRLRQALSAYTGSPVENILIGNGAAELIYLLLNVTRPSRVLIPAPTFSEYGLAVQVAGGEKINFPLRPEDDFALDIKCFIQSLPGVQAVFLCNPNNPTGILTRRVDILSLVEEAARQGIAVVIDEAFMDFVENPEEFSVLQDIHRFANLVVLYSLTKFFALPGLRLGAALGPAGIIKNMAVSKDPWNVNCFAQLAGEVSLQDKDYIARTRGYLRAEKAYLYNELQKIDGVTPYPPAANYIFCSVKGTGRTSACLTNEMGERGILIRDCRSYENLDDGYIRLAVRTREENDILLSCLREVLNEG